LQRFHICPASSYSYFCHELIDKIYIKGGTVFKTEAGFLDTPSLGLIEVFQELDRLDYGSFVPVKDRGIDVVGFNPRKNRFIAILVKTSSRHGDRYKSKGGEYGYWWDIPKKKHAEIKGRGVYYVLVGLQFDVRNRSVINRDFFIIESTELERLLEGGVKFDKKNQVWRLEVFYDPKKGKFISAHNPLYEFTLYHNAWSTIK
jgi:hypothetical protein